LLRREVEEAELVVYGRACPNCGGFISDRRLALGVPCSSCLRELPKSLDYRSVYRVLKEEGTLKGFKEYYVFRETYSDLVKFFVECLGSEPWSIQKMWLRRIAKEGSFAMIAPTGVGKTTFGFVVALYLARKGKKSYIVVPTTTLAMQAEKKLNELAGRANLIVSPVVIHSKLRKREREAREEQLESGSFDILVTTSNYLLRNAERILKHRFKFIFVDDVDAVLKGSKAINYLLRLTGFSERDIEAGMEIIRLRREAAYLSSLQVRAEKLEKRLQEIRERLEKLRNRIERKGRERRILIIASATGNPRGTRVRLFRELIGFEIGARPEFIRNIEDLYVEVDESEIPEKVLQLVKRLGRGGLVYVPLDKGIEYANFIADYLRKRGVRAEAMHSKNLKVLDSFIEGETEVLVGVATYYGVLVRGIDLPEIIRYAVFTGPPRHKVGLRVAEMRPQDVIRILPLLRDAVTGQEERQKIEASIVRLRRLLRRSGSFILQIFQELLEGKRKPETRAEELFLEVFQLVKELLGRPEVIERLRSNPYSVVKEENGELYVLIPDPATYLQASGRTSRLFLGGISKGVSVVLADDMRLLKGLEARLRWVIDDFRFQEFSEADLDSILDEVDRGRELIRRIREGISVEELKALTSGKGRVVELKTALLIVESPNKARTIARFFGRPSVREYGRLRVYEVNLGSYTLLITASGGHIYELITDLSGGGVDHLYGVARGKGGRFIPVYGTIKRCANGHQIVVEGGKDVKECPICGAPIETDTETVIEALRDVALEVDEVLVGTDPDTEGEKIAFDIVNVVLPVNKNVRRVEFHEVTKRAIINAVENPRSLDLNLVKAQLVRRVEDRWIGFSLSSRLQTDFWKGFCREILSSDVKESRYRRYAELCMTYRNSYRNLSAGRVQTPVLGWIIDTYRKHEASKTLFIKLVLGELSLEIPIPPERRKGIKRDIVKLRVRVKDLVRSEEEVNPLPPYTTDSVLYDISSKLKLPTQRAMQILQELFELGFITYHRTDSTRVSDTGKAVAREYMQEILGSDADKYFRPRSWGEGGAHECIRPTRPIDAERLRSLIEEGIIEPVRRISRTHFAVYDLIFRRFMASQSTPAKVRRVRGVLLLEAVLDSGEEVDLGEQGFEVVEEIMFDGFNRFYRVIYVRRPPEEGLYEVGKELFQLKEWYTQPLHTYASIVREMKEKEIGRPSTYAKIVDTLFKRKYVALSRSRSGIVPLLLGEKVYQYLTSRYGGLVSEERTRVLERKMRSVEEGKVDYYSLVTELLEELTDFKLLGR